MDAEGNSPVRFEHLHLDAWALCQEFVERIVSDARAEAARDNPTRPIPEVEWEAIWRAGEGASSDEAAIGRIVRAASSAAHGLAAGTSAGPHSPPTEIDRASSGLDPEAALVDLEATKVPQPPTGGEATVVEPAAATEKPQTAVVATIPVAEAATDSTVGRAEPGAAQVQPESTPAPSVPAGERETAIVPAVAPTESKTATMAPVPPDEPVTAPVPVVAVVGSVTLDRPNVGATTVTEPDRREELQISADDTGESDEGEQGSQRAARAHSEWVTVFTWVRNLGAVLILLVVWQLWGTAISQHQAQSQLKTAFEAQLRAHHPAKATASGPALIPASTVVPSPPDGSVVAELQIPAIGTDQYVVAGTNSTDLSKGPGHYIGTAAPGQAGNVAIAGHRTTHGAPFNALGHLVHGDRILLTTTSGKHLLYIVSGVPQTVAPNDVAVLNYFGDNRITLTTCTPEFSATQRLVVVGELKQRNAAPLPPPKHISYRIANAATSSWDWSLLPAVGLIICLLLLLGLSYRRSEAWFGKSTKWLILVPIWAAGLYLLFDTLTKFLPETV
jgi:LPXTG-site transpeptidase (sortase) family protein